MKSVTFGKTKFSLTKVLIIRFSSIGDIVLTTPVVRNLKEQIFGDVEIHYITKKSFAPLVESNPHISRVFTIEKSTNEVIQTLKEQNYHYIIDLHKNLRSARIKRALKVLSFSFDKLNWQKWLLVNFGINKLPKVHIVDRYMETLKAFGIENDNKGLDFFFSQDDEQLSIPSSHQNGYITMGIGAAHWRKKPRLEQYRKLCAEIDYPIILIGGPNEQDDGNKVAEAFGERVLNTAGKSNLSQSAKLIKESRLLISPDTGIMHIAAALKKPIISIWGATIPDFGMYPYQNENINLMVQADHLKKRPCSKLGTKCKYKPCKCIDELPLERITVAANRQIAP